MAVGEYSAIVGLDYTNVGTVYFSSYTPRMRLNKETEEWLAYYGRLGA